MNTNMQTIENLTNDIINSSEWWVIIDPSQGAFVASKSDIDLLRDGLGIVFHFTNSTSRYAFAGEGVVLHPATINIP